MNALCTVRYGARMARRSRRLRRLAAHLGARGAATTPAEPPPRPAFSLANPSQLTEPELPPTPLDPAAIERELRTSGAALLRIVEAASEVAGAGGDHT